jgi:hypothetical protein
MFFISKLITCFINGFSSEMKSQSIAYLPIENEVYSIWIKWPSRMQGQYIFRSWAGRATCFGRVHKIL